VSGLFHYIKSVMGDLSTVTGPGPLILYNLRRPPSLQLPPVHPGPQVSDCEVIHLIITRPQARPGTPGE